jgi:hypothetical protein
MGLAPCAEAATSMTVMYSATAIFIVMGLHELVVQRFGPETRA